MVFFPPLTLWIVSPHMVRLASPNNIRDFDVLDKLFYYISVFKGLRSDVRRSLVVVGGVLS